MTVKLNRKIARKVLETIDAGLVKGVGIPKPGKMCIEAAVCYALGLPHGDNPDCVARSLRAMKIALNDQSWRNATARAKGMRRLGLAQLGSQGMDEKEFLRRLSEFTIGVIVPRALRNAIKAGADKSLEAYAVRCEKEKSYAAASSAELAAVCAGTPAYARVASCAASCAAGADIVSAATRYGREALRAAHAAAYAAHAADAAAHAAYAAYAAYYAAYYAAAAAADAEREFFAEGVVQILVKMKVPGTKWLDLTE